MLEIAIGVVLTVVIVVELAVLASTRYPATTLDEYDAGGPWPADEGD